MTAALTLLAYLDPNDSGGTSAGTIIGIAVVVLIVAGIATEEIIRWRRRHIVPVRPCPRCGWDVKAGVLDCPHCGFDFRAIGGGTAQ